jgi:hypothetical protein
MGPANTVAPILKQAQAKGWKPLFLTDLGLGPQLKLNYSAKEHKGFDHVIPTVVRGGRAVPVHRLVDSLVEIVPGWHSLASLTEKNSQNPTQEKSPRRLFVRGFRLLEGVIRGAD